MEEATALDGSAWDRLYAELERRARTMLRGERANHTLEPSALVHEAFLRLADGPHSTARTAFLARGALCMRRVLRDHARARGREKRRDRVGRRVTLSDALVPDTTSVDAIDLDTALGDLEGFAPRAAEVFVARYFGGMTAVEAAASLDLAPNEQDREWRFAKSWIGERLAL